MTTPLIRTLHHSSLEELDLTPAELAEVEAELDRAAAESREDHADQLPE